MQMLDRQRVQQAAADEAKKLVDAAALASERLVDATKEAEETAAAAAAAAAGSKVNPGSPLGQPWVPDFWRASVGPRRKLGNGGSR